MKIKKITIQFLLLIGIFSYTISFWEPISTNKENFKNASSSRTWIVWVAITTNVWTRWLKNSSYNNLNNSIFNEIISIDGILSIRNNRKDELIKKNTTNIKEYLNILKTDTKALLKNSSNIRRTLDSFIKSLELKYKNSIVNKVNLEKQQVILKTWLVEIDSKIQDIKEKIATDFKNFNSLETNKNIKQYLKLREQYTIIRTYLIFVSKFIVQYDFLNSYNKNLLDTLINNKDIIIKRTFVVIPDTGSDLLKELDLIISEEEYKRIDNEGK